MRTAISQSISQSIASNIANLTTVSVSSLTRSAEIATAVIPDSSVLSVGDFVTISGADQALYNGAKEVLSIPDGTSFTYNAAGSELLSNAALNWSGGTLTDWTDVSNGSGQVLNVSNTQARIVSNGSGAGIAQDIGMEEVLYRIVADITAINGGSSKVAQAANTSLTNFADLITNLNNGSSTPGVFDHEVTGLASRPVFVLYRSTTACDQTFDSISCKEVPAATATGTITVTYG